MNSSHPFIDIDLVSITKYRYQTIENLPSTTPYYIKNIIKIHAEIFYIL